MADVFNYPAHQHYVFNDALKNVNNNHGIVMHNSQYHMEMVSMPSFGAPAFETLQVVVYGKYINF